MFNLLNKKITPVIFEQSLNSLLNFLITFFIAKKLGIEKFGQFSYFFIIVQIFLTFNYSLIISPFLTFYQKHKENSKKYFDTLLVIQLLFTIIAIFFIFIINFLLEKNLFKEFNYSLIYLILFSASTFLFNFFRYVFIIQNFNLILIIQNILKFIVIIFFTFILTYDSLDSIFILLVIINLISIIFAYKILLNLSFSSIILKKIVREFYYHSKWLFFSSFINSLLNNLIILSSGVFINSSTLGLIRLIQSIFNYVNIINISFENFLPKELGIGSIKIILPKIKFYSAIMFSILIMSYVIIYLLHNYIFKYFEINDQYASYYFIMFAIISFITCFNTILKILYRSIDKTKIIFKASVITLLITSILLIPIYLFLDNYAPVVILLMPQLISLYVLMNEIRK